MELWTVKRWGRIEFCLGFFLGTAFSASSAYISVSILQLTL